MKTSTVTRIAAIAIALGLTAGPAMAAPPTGAIFTTDPAGNVNVNIYTSKADVHLNGGPGPNAPCTAAGLDDGVYVFQITNPSGTVLLSTDTIDHREITVTNGVIVSANDHAPTVAGDCGSVRVPMAPFDDTPNNGGEYKAWVTLKDDYIKNNGFKPSATKTDNFKVKVPAPPEEGGILVYKFYDANGNGLWDSNEIPLFDWAMHVTGTNYDSTGLTQSPDGLVTFSGLLVSGNPYSVEEGLGGPRWVHSGSLVDGTPTANSPENPVSVTLVAGETTQVDFGNYCTCIIKPYPTSFWLGSSGQTKLNDGGSMNPEFKLLNGANLRNGAGANFNLNLATAESTNYATLNGWLMGASSSTNESYKLSAQLAVLKLNVEAAFARKTYFVKGVGTIEQIMADANALLTNTACGGSLCNTTTASQLGTDQAAIRAIIEDLNDGATVIMPNPCAYKFTLTN